MTAAWRDLSQEGGGHSRGLAVVERVEPFQLVGSMPKTTSRVAALPLPYQGPFWLPRGDVTRANDNFKGPGRLRTAMREVVALLIATSGVLAIVVIVLVVTMLLRALRALCRR